MGSTTDAESRITRMKDGATHLAYKAEHVVDLESEFLLAATVHGGDAADTETMVDSVMQSQLNLREAGSEQEIEEGVARGKRLQRLRSERVERSFAHVGETGGARRCWLTGLAKVAKRYLLQATARNLGLILRKLFGMGAPRGLQKEARLPR